MDGATSWIEAAGRWPRWFDPHPPLPQRIARLYGGTMPPLPLHDGLDPDDEPSLAPPV